MKYFELKANNKEEAFDISLLRRYHVLNFSFNWRCTPPVLIFFNSKRALPIMCVIVFQWFTQTCKAAMRCVAFWCLLLLRIIFNSLFLELCKCNSEARMFDSVNSLIWSSYCTFSASLVNRTDSYSDMVVRSCLQIIYMLTLNEKKYIIKQTIECGKRCQI